MKLPRIDKTPNFKHDEFDVFLKKMDSDEVTIVGIIDGNEKNWCYVDPFVSPAWDYERRSELLGKTFRVTGFWSGCMCRGAHTFLVDENGLTPTKTDKQE